MPTRVFVPLGPDELLALHRQAERERRTPQQQAALLLGDALIARERTQAAKPPKAEQATADV